MRFVKDYYLGQLGLEILVGLGTISNLIHDNLGEVTVHLQEKVAGAGGG